MSKNKVRIQKDRKGKKSSVVERRGEERRGEEDIELALSPIRRAEMGCPRVNVSNVMTCAHLGVDISRGTYSGVGTKIGFPFYSMIEP